MTIEFLLLSSLFWEADMLQEPCPFEQFTCNEPQQVEKQVLPGMSLIYKPLSSFIYPTSQPHFYIFILNIVLWVYELGRKDLWSMNVIFINFLFSML